MNKLKKILTMLLCVVMLVGLVPSTAIAANTTKLIALTFDDGPSSANTTRLLDGLKSRGAKVTFFMTGQGAKNNPDIVKRAYNEGHQICSHTYDHSLLTSLSDSEIKSNLSRTDKILDAAIGYDLEYQLRPPYGGYSDRVLNAVGVPCYYWSVDTRDWESLNTTAAYNMFIKYARNGSIVLMHDIHSTTIPAALQAIDTLQAEGYEFVTLNELLVRRGITPTAGQIYFDAYPSSKGTGKTISEATISYKDTASGKKIVISGDSRGEVYYTTDGKDPTPSHGKKYTGAFTVKDGTTVKAISVIYWNGFKSDITSKTIKYTTLKAPTVKITDGKLQLTGLTDGGTYYYTTNGKTPTTSSTKYTGAFTPTADTVYTFKGVAAGYNPSGVKQVTYGSSGKLYLDLKPSYWYYKDVDRAVGEGIISITAAKVKAEQNVTRADTVKMLYSLAGKPSVDGLTTDFADVSEYSAAYNAIVWAQNEGIVIGCGNNLFKPDEKVSREQMCAMLARYLQLFGTDISAFDSEAVNGFADAEDIEPSIADCLNAVCALGIVRGYEDNTIRPRSNITKAEAVTMLMRTEDITVKLELDT